MPWLATSSSSKGSTKTPVQKDNFVLIDSTQSERYKNTLSALVTSNEPWYTGLLPAFSSLSGQSSGLAHAKPVFDTKEGECKMSSSSKVSTILSSILSSFLLLLPSLLFLFPDCMPLQHLAVISIFVDPILAPYVLIDLGHFLACEHLKILALVIPRAISVEMFTLFSPFPSTEAWKNTVVHVLYVPLVFYITQIVHSCIFYLTGCLNRRNTAVASIDGSYHDLYAQYTCMNHNLLLLLLSPLFSLILIAAKCAKGLTFFTLGLVLLFLGGAEITCIWTCMLFGLYPAEADHKIGTVAKVREGAADSDHVQSFPAVELERYDEQAYLVPGNKAQSDLKNLSPRDRESCMKLAGASNATYESIATSQSELGRRTLLGDLYFWFNFVFVDFAWSMTVSDPWKVATGSPKWRYSRKTDTTVTGGQAPPGIEVENGTDETDFVYGTIVEE